MHVETFTVSPFSENCHIVHDGGEAALIDPGTATPEERRQVMDYLEAEGLRVRHLLLTHAHIDHIFGCAYFDETFGKAADFGGWQLHPAEEPLLANARVQAELFGVRISEPPAPTRALSEDETVELGEHTFTILHAPGHSPGSVCFYCEAAGILIGGDVLFEGSIGRTDLWEGSLDTLLKSIRTKLFTLPDETVVYPGHGPETTIGREKRSNPFLQPGAEF
ncbi:MBL fold metallo-hydrolase [soil metagenome]